MRNGRKALLPQIKQRCLFAGRASQQVRRPGRA
jgi:hypothetical protein